jgi:hypothetical protein
MRSEASSRKLVFLSHSHKDVELANSAKEHLEWRFAINLFVAHEDLTPSEEWQTEILRMLRKCDAFIPLLTRNFARSNWTDQETGLALAFKKLIIPIRVDVNPYGFVGKLQALRWDRTDITSGVNKLAQVLFQKHILSTDELIRCLRRSRNYDDAGFKAKVLRDADGLSRRQINEIAHAAIQNEQVHGASSAKTPLRTLFQQHSHSIDRQTKKALKRLSLMN